MDEDAGSAENPPPESEEAGNDAPSGAEAQAEDSPPQQDQGLTDDAVAEEPLPGGDEAAAEAGAETTTGYPSEGAEPPPEPEAGTPPQEAVADPEQETEAAAAPAQPGVETEAALQEDGAAEEPVGAEGGEPAVKEPVALNVDGLAVTAETIPGDLEVDLTVRPAVPPPSRVDMPLSAAGPGRQEQDYMQQRLKAFSVGQASDEDASELAEELGSDDWTPRRGPYPVYRRPDNMSPPPEIQFECGHGYDELAARPPAAESPSGDAAAGGDAARPTLPSSPPSSPTPEEAGGPAPGRPVLPPDHPLMARFQRALANLLQRQIGQLDLDLAELKKERRARTTHREACGVQLYERQLQLSRQQQLQLQLMEQLRAAEEARGQQEARLDEVRTQHDEMSRRLEADRCRERDLRMDAATLEKHEYHLKSLENDADTELQLRQKMAERAEAEMSQLEKDKQRQDYLISRLTADAERLRTAIRLNQVQTGAQTEETSLARQVLAEAQLELDTLVMEKKHLTQTWANTLNVMQKRDQEHAKLQNDVSKMAADLHTVDGEISGYMRSIRDEQDRNEQFMMQFNRLQSERDKFKRAYDQTIEKFDMQKDEYARFQRMLHDTEDKLYQCQTDQKQVERRLRHLRADMERVLDAKRQVEDTILETMQERLTSDSAGRYTAKIVARTRDVTKYMESQVADVENNIARLLLAVSNASTAVTYMKTVVDQLLAEVRLAEEQLNRYEVEIHRGNAVIQQKQNKVQELNAKLGALIMAAGGKELGPLEIVIASLNKAIDQLQQEVDAVQQYYLRIQNDLVFSTQERDSLRQVVERRKKELLIMEQRKMRVERSIETECVSLHAVELSVKQLRQAVCHLNVRLAGESKLHQELAANTSVMEYELCHALRESETQCVQLRQDIADKERRRAALMAEMAEAAARELLWEQKNTLLKQAKQKLKGETGCAAEVRAMRLEIHRMQVRYGQLLREQERLMTEMERAVDRRGVIAARAENAQKQGRQRAVNFFQRQKKIEDLKRKFKQTRRDAAHLQSELQRLEVQLEQLQAEMLPEQRAAVQQLQQLVADLRRDLHHSCTLRAQNLSRIVLKQQSSKYYQSLLEGHYTNCIKSLSRLQIEVDSTDEKHKSMRMLVRQLLRDRPELEPRLRFVREILKL